MRSESIRIHDLSSPELPSAVREMMQAAVAMTGAVSLDAERILCAAVEQTGLDDFGDPGFREPLGELLDAIEHEARLSAFGRVTTFAMLAPATAMDVYVVTHPRGRHGRVDYRLGDFGLRAEELRERFRFYLDRFGLEEEAVAE